MKNVHDAFELNKKRQIIAYINFKKLNLPFRSTGNPEILNDLQMINIDHEPDGIPA